MVSRDAPAVDVRALRIDCARSLSAFERLDRALAAARGWPAPWSGACQRRVRELPGLVRHGWCGRSSSASSRRVASVAKSDTVVRTTKLGVRSFGTPHGAAFIVYVSLTVLVANRLERRLGRTTIFGLLAAVPPFMTVAFGMWARRTGRLPQSAAASHSTPAR
ncbi:DUF3817 domain-containing protein [Streptomyces zhihengii]|uniref:DUF3817 domain-containing protein n=1 Tax=Streptomyces zhihengii TaxID=1818004 RepID=UPI003624FD51